MRGRETRREQPTDDIHGARECERRRHTTAALALARTNRMVNVATIVSTRMPGPSIVNGLKLISNLYDRGPIPGNAAGGLSW